MSLKARNGGDVQLTCGVAGGVLSRTIAERVDVTRVSSADNSSASRLPAVTTSTSDGVRLPKIGERPGTQRKSMRGRKDVSQERRPTRRTASSPLCNAAAAKAAGSEAHCTDASQQEKRRTRPSICTAFSKSSADALYLIADSLGWSVHTHEREDSNLYWVVSADHMQQRILKMKAGQTVARVPGMHNFSNKCSFSVSTCF